MNTALTSSISLPFTTNTFRVSLAIFALACLITSFPTRADDADHSRQTSAATWQSSDNFIGFSNTLPGPPSFLQKALIEHDGGRFQTYCFPPRLTTATQSQIQQVSFDSTVTFLTARSTGSTPIAAATDEVSKTPTPDETPVPSPAETPKPATSGNVMVIPSTAPAPAAAQATKPTPPRSAAVAIPADAPPTGVVTAESPTSETAAPSVTLEIIAAQRAAAEQLSDLTEELKTQLTTSFQSATAAITLKIEIDKKIAELKEEIKTGPAKIAEYTATDRQPPPRSEPEYPLGASVAELEQLRLADDERAKEAKRNYDVWDAKSKARAERKPQMPALIEAARKSLEDAEKELLAAQEAEHSAPSALNSARRLAKEAAVMLRRSELDQLEIEQSRYEALNDLFPLQGDVLKRVRISADKRVELWKKVMTDARRDESDRQAQEAREKLRNAHPTLRDLAEDNSRLTLRRKELQEFMQTKVKELTEANATLANLEEKFKKVTEKENRAGLTTAIGLLLRSQRSHLPNPADYHQLQYKTEQDIVRLQTEQMPLEDERNDLSDIESQVENSLSLVPTSDEENSELRQMALELLTARRTYLNDLLTDYDQCLLTLGDTAVTCLRLETTIHEYRSYIDERVLWIRSAPAVDTSLVQKTLDKVRMFVSNRQWAAVWKFIIKDTRTYWPVYGLSLSAFVAIAVFSRRMRRTIATYGEDAQKQLGAGIPLMLLATGLTIIMAAAWPMLLWFAGWRLSFADLNLASALSVALMFCAAALWLVDCFRKLCRSRGVAESFLDWPQPIVRSLHANLLLYVVGGIPLSFIVGTASELDEGTSADSVGRLAFVSFCLLMAVMLRRIVRPSGAVIGDLLRSNPNSMMYRLRWLWYPFAIGSPLFLAVLALMGYQYTAEQLMIRLQLTLVLSIVLVITYTMLMQWMLAAKRSLAMKQARARRAAALAAAQRDSEEDGSAASPMPAFEPPQVDLSLLNQQMLRLVQGTACILFLTIGWGIWGQVLPALQVFSRIELWTPGVEITQQASESVDSVATGKLIQGVPVTLGNLLSSILIFTIAVLSSRNLPGLLELAILQRLPMDHGGRNAITTLCRYTFMLTGGIIACNMIGINWNSVQWLAAALTVGLGFGLQEIFANFVSGLIILFERPVRIGDVVTIDGVTGSVSHIQIRATTITDWDRKEYIVPNKEFVTGKILNWTLSDKTNRIVIKVGVAYGTDTEAALAMLQQIAEEHPLILGDPAPAVAFEGFGESCLDLVLRCFLPNLDNRLKVLTQLHVTIDRKFKEAGIEIAFPQRDLHIRSLPPQLGAAATADQSPLGNENQPQNNVQQARRSA